MTPVYVLHLKLLHSTVGYTTEQSSGLGTICCSNHNNLLLVTTEPNLTRIKYHAG